jgi:cholesterol transport system auxiliary component
VRSTRRLAVAAFALAAVSGCALTQKARPLEVAYYTPEVLRPGVTSRQGAPCLALRLGSVASGTDLGIRIVVADGAYRVRYYDSRRWTERPENYLRRALARALFEDGGFPRAMSGDAPTLDVELLTFEEVEKPAQHAARIVLRFILSTNQVLVQDTIAVSQPVLGGRFDDVVAAMGRALDEASGEVEQRVGLALDCRNSAHAPVQ